ncbi:MAG: hypothetical protein IIC28_05910 [Chloroflexi bacterium]|nr:hypothetical protein [Chloroflexota bacterium]MCI0836783.1 hypothetical protein [Chloroflexota bacterium]MCI0873596.1 hypothetical protein [Chloroflexota bacterium]
MKDPTPGRTELEVDMPGGIGNPEQLRDRAVEAAPQVISSLLARRP